MKQLLATRAILYPKFLIKYHKTTKQKGKFPTRLVIPSTNFTEMLSKIGYLGIKIVLDKAKVNYLCVSIIQASELKKRLEELYINRDGVTIESVDAINMYPSIKLITIRKELRLVKRKLTASTKKK